MSESPGLTVLVVEDDPAHQLLIRRALTEDESPFSVVQFADNSVDAEHFARQMSFDVLLVDNRIPGRRGLDLISFLKSEGATAPFVLMTSAGNEELAVHAYRSQVADYIVKDSSFWRDLPQLLARVVEEDRARKNEKRLRERLERANQRLDELNTEVQLQNQQLLGTQAEVKARNDELEALNRRLRDAYQTLGDFTVALAHSLGKPLAAVQSSLAALDGAAPKAAPHLAELEKAAHHIASILERIQTMGVEQHEDPSPDLDALFDRLRADLQRGTGG
ncbi:MAG: response regulator [Deltaproteobacteria bacterium]|nr:response regulator [Deltaproteobacteria bacterium]